MALTVKELDALIRKAQATGRALHAYDAGVRWLALPSGTARATKRVIVNGKDRSLSLGTYPGGVTIAEARAKAAAAKVARRNGANPAAEKARAKLAARLAEHAAEGTSFEVVARQWHARSKAKWTERHAGYVMRRMEATLFPDLGPRPLNAITPPELLLALRKAEGRGKLHMARRALQYASAVFRLGVATGLCERDCAADLGGALAPAPREQHHEHLKPGDIGPFLKALDAYQGHPTTKNSIRFLMLTAVRPGKELCLTRWPEIDMKAATWVIPAERMKMREAHTVCLSKQALAVLKEQMLISGGDPQGFVFPGTQDSRKPQSNNALVYAMRTFWKQGAPTAHGLRSTFSTAANESGHFRPDVVEAALAHQEPDAIRRAYNRAALLAERRRLMEWWGAYIVAAQSDGTVVQMKRARQQKVVA